MARRLESAADAHERDAERRERAGDPRGARREWQRAAEARRAAAILAAGPGGVAAIFGG
jgi:hypothetical protein